MAAKSLTLTYYQVVKQFGGEVVGTHSSEAVAVEHSAKHHVPTLVRHVETTYCVGQRVAVHAFGRWRQGVVVSLGRTRVTVDYQSNQQGGRRTKAFGAIEIRSGR